MSAAETGRGVLRARWQQPATRKWILAVAFWALVLAALSLWGEHLGLAFPPILGVSLGGFAVAYVYGAGVYRLGEDARAVERRRLAREVALPIGVFVLAFLLLIWKLAPDASAYVNGIAGVIVSVLCGGVGGYATHWFLSRRGPRR